MIRVTFPNLKKRMETVMKNRIALVLALAALIVGTNAPAAPAKIAFEVASVKPAVRPGRGPVICFVPCTPGERLTVQGNRVDIRYMSINELLIRAYRVKPYQVSGPEWMRNARFDIIAKIPEGVPADRIPEMLQSMLADRFQLKIHRETKERPIYALVVGKNGIKLQPAATDAVQAPASPKARPVFTPDGEGHFDSGGVTITSGRFGPIRSVGGGKWEMSGVTMPGLAELLAPEQDRPVLDETNLSGAYRFIFEVEAHEGGRGQQEGRGPGPQEDAVRTSLIQSVEKGGLKLERRNAPIETIVVDTVEKTPTAN